MLVNYFVILSTLLLFAGLTLDAGLLEWRALHLQNAADATAQEAMYEKARNDSNWASAAQAQAIQNFTTNGVNGVTVSISNPPASGPHAGDSLAFQATVSQSVSNLFMGLVNGGNSTVAATSVAQILPTCMWIMNPDGGSTLHLASARLTATCGVYVNTSTGGNLEIDGFSTFAAKRIRVVGSSSSNLSTGKVSPIARFNATPKSDPLGYVTAPIFNHCDVTGSSYSSLTSVAYPGTYCGGISLNNTTVYMYPGLYIITGGITLRNNSYLYGLGGVTMYFTAGGGSGYGTVDVVNSYIYLKAPTTTVYGGIPGVVMFADRAWITHGQQGFRFTASQLTTDGVWYLLNTGLFLWQSPFSYYKYNGLVADNIYQYNSPVSLAADYSDLNGASPYHYEDGVLVQ